MAKVRQGKRDYGKESKWIERMREWEASGLGARQFCNRTGYKEVQFHWWKRVLQERGKWKPEIAPVADKEGLSVSPPPFAEIQIAQPLHNPGNNRQNTSHADGMIQIEMGEQYRIRVPSGFDPATLDRILTVLEERSC